VQQPLGGIAHNRVHWMNRPTYQQVIEFPARRGDDVANLARTGTATASSVESGWETAYARAYRIEVSRDNVTWQQVYATTTGDGGRDVVQLAPVTARYVRITGTRRATSYGYSLYEFELYQH
ncbi:MAG TPA: discoidin domain-containing protein, partial [Kribbellaceae bacterium]